jgi:hypothetical protein
MLLGRNRKFRVSAHGRRALTHGEAFVSLGVKVAALRRREQSDVEGVFDRRSSAVAVRARKGNPDDAAEL